MRKLLFILLFSEIIFSQAIAQQPYTSIDCWSLNQPSFNGNPIYFENYGCITIPGTGNVNISGNKKVDIVSETEIHLRPGFQAQGFSNNGYFHGQLKPRQLDLAIYSPLSNPGNVAQYDKLEIGVQLPDDVMENIDNFLNEIPHDALNPFNPEDIDVKAEFFRYNNNNTWSSPFRVYGFYYEEFNENLSDSDPINWTLDNVATEHKFRIRFAPPYVGLWRCKITVTVNQTTTYEASNFLFNCVSSSDKGYVKVGANKLYMQLGSETYIPISRNIPQPDLSTYGAPYSAKDVDSINTYDRRKIHPSYHLTYRDELTAYKNAGGEEFRFVNFGDWYEIEFEKLNNYYDRLNSAWELDRLIEHCENIDLKMYFNMQNHEPFQWVGDQTRFWDWPAHDEAIEDQSLPTCYSWDTRDIGNCYHTDPGFGVATPEEFLTDADAKKFYQYRLRYITSRWGYSTNISLFEIRSEMNNHAKYQYPVQVVNPNYDPNDTTTWPQVTCDKTTPEYKYYTNDDNFLTKVSDWNHEMAAYLKTHQYFPHLLSVDYTGNPRAISLNNSNYYAILLGDESYYSSHVDLAAYNSYPSDIPINRFEGQVENNRDLNHWDAQDHGAPYLTPKINKPLIIGETGFEPAQLCDNGIEYVKDLWIGFFTGHANAGNQWHYQQQYNLIQHHQYLKEFLSGVNLTDAVWQPGYDVRGDKRGAVYFIQSNENKRRAMGVIENRTFNYYTAGCKPLFDSEVDDDGDLVYGQYIPSETNPGGNDAYTSPQTFAYGSGSNRLKIPDMGRLKKYEILWYNVLTNSQISLTEKRSQTDGDLVLEYPDLYGSFPTAANNWQESPLIAFKIWRKNEPAFSPEIEASEAENVIALLTENEESSSQSEPAGIKENEITSSAELLLSPNPAGNSVTVLFKGVLENARLKITSLQSTLVYASNLTTNLAQINVSALAPGTYLVIIENNGNLYIGKLIKL